MGGDIFGAAPLTFDHVLAPQPSSVATARHLVRELLNGVGLDELVDDAMLLASELVTNAVIHAGSQVRVTGRVVSGVLRVEVTDASPHHPALRNYAETAGTGRGLALLVALVDHWGVTPAHEGKTVWFELSGAKAPGARVQGARTNRPGAVPTISARRSAQDTPREEARASIQVQLLMMPLLLHEAWREHAETLLREYLLAALDFQDPTAVETVALEPLWDPVQVHAAATDALALLEEQVPLTETDMDPAKLMAGATEPRVTAPELQVSIPRDSVPHFAILQRVLDQTLSMVDTGLVSAPRTQPEVQTFRRWVCRQVELQAGGRPAEAWTTEATTVIRSARATALPVEEVVSSTDSLIAADEGDRIVAASASVAKLLGYDRADELVGRRLLAIIPNRFHQAHIAGFTLHQLVGRSPLLEREVDVPALRRDGTEVDVRLKVARAQASNGAPYFVARLREVSS
jgi:PAS domain S-box-containing protein